MIPHVGDVVYLWPNVFMQRELGSREVGPMAAMVVMVWNKEEDALVNLKVFTDGPIDHWVTSVAHRIHAASKSSFWDWPA